MVAASIVCHSCIIEQCSHSIQVAIRSCSEHAPEHCPISAAQNQGSSGCETYVAAGMVGPAVGRLVQPSVGHETWMLLATCDYLRHGHLL